MITRVIQMFGGEAELRSFPTKDLFTRVIHVKEESLLGGRSEAPLPPNKRFFLIVYKMLVLGLVVGARAQTHNPEPQHTFELKIQQHLHMNG